MPEGAISYEEAKKIAAGNDPTARQRLARHAKVPSEILFFLANDAEPQVRLEVARNEKTLWEADQILAKDADPDVRSAITDKIIEKIDGPEDYENKESPLHRVWGKVVGVFDDLIEDSVAYIRRKVSRTIIAKEYFPKETVEKLLNHDDPEIATYAIQHAKGLSDDELLSLLATGADCMPAAIASRKDLSEHVVNAVVKNGDKAAVKKVVENKTADISDSTMDSIISSAETDEDIQSSLVDRPPLTLPVIKRIAMIVSQSLIKELIINNKLSREDAAVLFVDIQKRIDGEDMQKLIKDVMNNEFFENNFGSPEETAYQDFLNGRLKEDIIRQAIECNQTVYVISALSLRSNVPIEAVQKTFDYKNGKALVAVIWRAGFSMRLALDIQQKLLKMRKGIVYPRNGKGFPFAPKEMSWQIDFFAGLGEDEDGA